MQSRNRILFVCSANKQRSKTAEDYFSKKYPSIQFQSGGTNHKACIAEGTTPLTKDLIDWAELVFLMEWKHKKIIQMHIGNLDETKFKVLEVPDDYKYYQKELLDLLERKITPYLSSK